jgi:20S proteasome alpha/beta subunit
MTDTKTAELYMVEPSGLALRYFGCAAGKGTSDSLQKKYCGFNKASMQERMLQKQKSKSSLFALDCPD